MSQKLETYIKQHRQDFDFLDPSPLLLSGIEQGMGKSALVKSKLAWLKSFWFGASLLVTGGAIVLFTGKNPELKRTLPEKQIPVVKDSARAEVVLADTTVYVAPKQIQHNIVSAVKKADTVKVSDVAESPVIVKEEQPVVVAQSQPAIPVTFTESPGAAWDSSFQDIRNLKLDISDINVIVEVHAKKTVQISSDIKLSNPVKINEREYEVVLEKKGSELEIEIRPREKQKNHTCNKNAEVRIYVPADIGLNSQMRFGNISVKGLSSNSLKLQSASGNILLEDVSGKITVNNSFGSLKARNLNGELEAHLSSGNVGILNAEGKFDVESSFGSIEFTNVKGKITSNCASGNHKINNCEAVVSLRSTFGAVKLDNLKGSGSVSVNSGNIIGKAIQVNGDLDLKNSFGAIKMQFSNKLEELSFDGRTTFGQIHMEKEGNKISETSHFVFGKGPFKVNAVTESGSQYYE